MKHKGQQDGRQKRSTLEILASVLFLFPSLALRTNGLLHPRPATWSGRQHRSTIQTRCTTEPSVAALQLVPETIAASCAVTLAGGAALLWLSGAEDRSRRARYDRWDAEDLKRREEMARRAYVEPREAWTLEELAHYDGSDSEDGPILFAADGEVFNVWKGRHFYGPGCEYHIFAGKDATRLLAKSKLEEETEEEMSKPLTIGERAALAGWVWTFKSKYDIVGRLEGFDPSTTKM